MNKKGFIIELTVATITVLIVIAVVHYSSEYFNKDNINFVGDSMRFLR